MQYALILVGVALLTLFICGVQVFNPRLAWRWRLYGTRWMYAEPDRLEPSWSALAFIRVTGVVMAVVVVNYVLLPGTREALARTVVDTGPGTPGATAVGLDRTIRESARARHGDPRDREVASYAIDNLDDGYCSRLFPSQPEAVDRCTRDRNLPTARTIEVADDYPRSGRITVRSGDPRDFDAQTVCLTVAADPAVKGEIVVGTCPRPRT